MVIQKILCFVLIGSDLLAVDETEAQSGDEEDARPQITHATNIEQMLWNVQQALADLGQEGMETDFDWPDIGTDKK